MSLDELRAHRDHKFGEHHGWCGYCWLEGESTAGEFQGGSYDYYVPISELTRGVEHPADGTMSPAVGNGGEYAPEPAYHNPFALVGSIGGFLDLEHQPSVGERIYNAYRRDIIIGMQVRRPIDMIIISGIS